MGRRKLRPVVQLRDRHHDRLTREAERRASLEDGFLEGRVEEVHRREGPAADVLQLLVVALEPSPALERNEASHERDAHRSRSFHPGGGAPLKGVEYEAAAAVSAPHFSIR